MRFSVYYHAPESGDYLRREVYALRMGQLEQLHGSSHLEGPQSGGTPVLCRLHPPEDFQAAVRRAVARNWIPRRARAACH